MKKITILIPAYNESPNVVRTVEALDVLADQMASHTYLNADKFPCAGEYDWEYLFVNDGSTDDTLSIIRSLREINPRVNVVNLSRNFGKESALLAGMDYAKGDAVISFDADLQHPVSAIPEMIYWWEQGYDDVYGKRETRGRQSWLRNKLSLTFYRMLHNAAKIDIPQNVGDFRLLDRRVVKAIRSLRETQRYTKGLYSWVGYEKKEVTYRTDDRKFGKSSFTFRSLFNLAIDGLTSFTTAPLRASSILGFLVSLCAFGYLCYVLVKALMYGDPVAGFPTLVCIILFLGGIQLIVLGIIGEYIGRIFNDTKGRPVYIAESYNEDKL